MQAERRLRKLQRRSRFFPVTLGVVKSIVHCRDNLTGDSTHGSSEVTKFGGTSEWLVALVAINGVLPLPTGTTEVLEALEVAGIWLHLYTLS